MALAHSGRGARPSIRVGAGHAPDVGNVGGVGDRDDVDDAGLLGRDHCRLRAGDSLGGDPGQGVAPDRFSARHPPAALREGGYQQGGVRGEEEGSCVNRPNNPPEQVDRAAVVWAGRWLQYATMAWNAAECVVALTAGFVPASNAPLGVGFDSAIEVTSSVAALWRLRRDPDEARREASERRAMQIIGVCFLLLAAYVLYDAI